MASRRDSTNPTGYGTVVVCGDEGAGLSNDLAARDAVAFVDDGFRGSPQVLTERYDVSRDERHALRGQMLRTFFVLRRVDTMPKGRSHYYCARHVYL